MGFLGEQLRVTVHGAPSRPALVLVHGFGCDQGMWGRLLPYLEAEHQVVTYDQAGSGGAAAEAYDEVRHATLDGYAEDLLGICTDLGLDEVVVVGHSIGAMIGVLAHLDAPETVAGLVMLAPSPRFLDEPPYRGGFTPGQIELMRQSLRQNFTGWAEEAGPALMGHPDQPELAAELTDSLLRTGPEAADAFADVTFLSDTRGELPDVTCPTLVLQVRRDPFVPPEVGRYVCDRIPGSEYAEIDTDGHFPHASAPEETAAAILAFVRPIQSFLRRTRD